MKGEKVLKLLEIIEEATWALSDMVSVFTLPYGSSRAQIQRHFLSRELRRKSLVDELRKSIKDSQRLYEFVYHLEKDGLVERKKKGKKRFLYITTRGKRLLEKLRLRKKMMMPKKSYHIQSDNILKIVIFDIPERERTKRDWLRVVLKNLGFKMLQKSVWVGKIKLPRSFLEDLQNFRLLDYIEIFATSKTGSLKHISL